MRDTLRGVGTLFSAWEQDSWTALASRLFPTTSSGESTQADLEAVVSRDVDMINTLVEIGVSPLDEHNTQLLDNVHPANWVDAEPDGTYNLVAIGGGTGGLVSAAGSAGVYAKVSSRKLAGINGIVVMFLG